MTRILGPSQISDARSLQCRKHSWFLQLLVSSMDPEKISPISHNLSSSCLTPILSFQALLLVFLICKRLIKFLLTGGVSYLYDPYQSSSYTTVTKLLSYCAEKQLCGVYLLACTAACPFCLRIASNKTSCVCLLPGNSQNPQGDFMPFLMAPENP